MDVIIDKDLRYVVAALPSFGTRYAHLVMGYAQLFGVTPMHLQSKKLRIIIEEMKKLFDAESFAWEKKTYSISHVGIGEALDICIKKNFTKKLENHNYLKCVMITVAEREGKGKSIRGEKDLRKKESILMIGDDRQGDSLIHHSGEGLNPETEEGCKTRSIEDLPVDIRKGIDTLKNKLGININNIGKRIV